MITEANIIRFLQTNASIGWISFFQFVTLFGSYLGLIIFFAIIFFRDKKLSVVFVVTFVVASVFNQLLKQIIMRDRPFVTYPDIENYGGADGYSMPSGHSVCGGLYATFLFYTILKTSRRKSTKVLCGIFCTLFPLLTAYSRMVLGVHYLSDTLVGIAVGVIFALLAIFLYKFYLKRRKIAR